MGILDSLFVMYCMAGILWMISLLVVFIVAWSGGFEGLLLGAVRFYAITSAVTAILSVPSMTLYDPPDDLASFVLYPLLECVIFGIASYAIGWNYRLHGDFAFSKWYVWGKRLVLTGVCGIAAELLVAIIVISVTQ